MAWWHLMVFFQRQGRRNKNSIQKGTRVHQAALSYTHSFISFRYMWQFFSSRSMNYSLQNRMWKNFILQYWRKNILDLSPDPESEPNWTSSLLTHTVPHPSIKLNPLCSFFFCNHKADSRQYKIWIHLKSDPSLQLFQSTKIKPLNTRKPYWSSVSALPSTPNEPQTLNRYTLCSQSNSSSEGQPPLQYFSPVHKSGWSDPWHRHCSTVL